MNRIAILDYGVGNLRSVEKALAAAGAEATISSDRGLLRETEALVLPGVGAFAACMKELSARGFDELIRERALEGAPILGVCVGMQMLFEESEEFGVNRGLGLLRGRVRKFSGEERVPQVGWNQVTQARRHPLLDGIDDGTFFYFVHSFYCEPEDSSTILGETDYGVVYASIVASNRICGVQFHPEKSQAPGIRLLGNFARMT